MWPFKKKPKLQLSEIPPPPMPAVVRHVNSRFTCHSVAEDGTKYFVFESENEEAARHQFEQLPEPNPGHRYEVVRLNVYVSKHPAVLDWQRKI